MFFRSSTKKPDPHITASTPNKYSELTTNLRDRLIGMTPNPLLEKFKSNLNMALEEINYPSIKKNEMACLFCLQNTVFQIYVMQALGTDIGERLEKHIREISQRAQIDALMITPDTKSEDKATDKAADKTRILRALSTTYTQYPLVQDYLISQYFRKAMREYATSKNLDKLVENILNVAPGNLNWVKAWNKAVAAQFEKDKKNPLHELLTLSENPNPADLKTKLLDVDANAIMRLIPPPDKLDEQLRAADNLMLIQLIDDLTVNLDKEIHLARRAKKEISVPLQAKLKAVADTLEDLANDLQSRLTFELASNYRTTLRSTIAMLYADIYCDDRSKNLLGTSVRGNALKAFSAAIQATANTHFYLSHSFDGNPLLMRLKDVEYPLPEKEEEESPTVQKTQESKDAKESESGSKDKGNDDESRIFQAFSLLREYDKNVVVTDRFRSAIHLGLDKLAEGDGTYLTNCIKMMSQERFNAVKDWNKLVDSHFESKPEFAPLHKLLHLPGEWVGDKTFKTRISEFLKSVRSSKKVTIQNFIQTAKGIVDAPEPVREAQAAKSRF